jgi:hypothetical protein
MGVSKKSIMLAYQKESRDRLLFESIGARILAQAPEVRLCVTSIIDPMVVLLAKQMGVTDCFIYPMTSVGLHRDPLRIKALTGCRVLSMRSEGTMVYDSPKQLKFQAGMDRYPATLVDRELFWGPRMAQLVGQEMMRQDKLTSLDRVEVVGYPKLEAYFDADGLYAPPSDLPLTSDTRAFIAGAAREKVVLVISGFYFADYTEEEIFRAGDMDPETSLSELLSDVNAVRLFRDRVIAGIEQAVRAHPDVRIIVKLHPIEVDLVFKGGKAWPFATLSDLPQVHFVGINESIEALVSVSGLLVHYGSTCALDAFLMQVPTMRLKNPESRIFYVDDGRPADILALSCDFGEALSEWLTAPVPFAFTEDIRRTLWEDAAIDLDKPYQPIQRIVDLILADEPSQPL